MTAFIHKLTLILTIAIGLAISPLCRAYSLCQTLGEYCGDPPTTTFPACCPFDTDANDKHVALKCKNIDNDIGTCEIDEDSGDSDSSKSSEGDSSDSEKKESKSETKSQ